MFGYVKVDLPNLYVKDTVLYKASYCGLCKSIGKCCNGVARFSLSYDLAFLSVLMHSVLGIDLTIERKHCVIHPIKKRPVAKGDELTDRIANLNVILAYYKLSDDVIDNNKGKLKRSLFKSAYRKAKKQEPNLDRIVADMYKKLRELETSHADSIDMVADPFGKMMENIVKELAGSVIDDNLIELSYNLGKWIYLIDALDDLEKDIKKGQFNVFHNRYKNVNTKQELIQNHAQEIALVFGTVLEIISQKSKLIKYKFNHDLTDNILGLGLKATFKQVTENKKCKDTKY